MKERKGVLCAEKRQEKTSLRQVALYLDGWNLANWDDDVSIDRTVHILDSHGDDTGVFFNLQMKSTTSMKPYLDDGRQVPYELDVRHLQRWESYSLPVIVIVWDTVQQTGVWSDVPGLIATLDETLPSWRTQKTVTVHLSERCDEGSRRRIQQRVAQLCLPTISRGRSIGLNLELRFPPTAEGLALDAALQRLVDEGGPSVTVPRKFAKLSFEQWYQTAIGASEPEFESITIGGSAPRTSPPLLLRLAAEAEEGIVLDMRHVRGGRVATCYDNEQQRSLAKLALTIRTVQGSGQIELQFSFRLFGDTAANCRRLARILRALRMGNRVWLEDSSTSSELCDLAMPNLDHVPSLEHLDWLDGVYEKAARVQNAVKRFGQLRIERPPMPDELRTLDQLYAWCTAGHWEERGIKFSFELDSAGRSRLRSALAGRRTLTPLSIVGVRSLTLFGVHIVQGRVEAQVPDVRKCREAMRRATTSGVMKMSDTTMKCRALGPATEEEIADSVERKRIEESNKQTEAMQLAGRTI